MDERRLKFIREFNDALETYLASEGDKKLKATLSLYFFDIGAKTLQKKERMRAFPSGEEVPGSFPSGISSGSFPSGISPGGSTGEAPTIDHEIKSESSEEGDREGDIAIPKTKDDFRIVKAVDYLNPTTSINSDTNRTILKKIELIKGKLKERKKQNLEHRPTETASFLGAFSLDPTLKFITHDWDESLGEFDYEKFILEISDSFLEKLEKYPNVPSATLWKFFSFVFDGNNTLGGWGYEKIKFGWSSPELVDWSKNHPGEFPLGMQVPFSKREYFVSNLRHVYNHFGEIVNKFKKEVRFTNERNHFLTFLSEKTREWGLRKEHVLDFDEAGKSLYGLDFYVDVDKFSAGLKKVVLGIKERTEFPEVYFFSKRNKNYVELIIHQLGAQILRQTPDDPKIKKETLSGDFSSALNNFKGHCDWSFEGPFLDGKSYRMNYLNSLGAEAVEESNVANGVQHVFRFFNPEP